jgi:ABC-type multidrug transport system fused ATPase/permease subunit
MFNNRPPRIDLEELKKLLNSSTNNKQDIKKIEAKQKKILNNIERLIKAYEKLQKGNERVFHKIKLIANLIIVYLSAPIAILAIFFVGGLVTENWLETVLFVLVIITLIGIFPGSYVAYLYYKEKT